MTKLITCIIIISFISVSGSAQAFQGGVTGGISASQVRGDFGSGYRKLGLVGGGFVKTKFNPTWGMQFELKYTGKGSREVVNRTNLINAIFLRYLELPFMVQYYLADNQFLKPVLSDTIRNSVFFEIGILTGYLLEANIKSGGHTNEDIKFNSFDYSYLLGINYKISSQLTANLRYSYSLISLNNSKPTFSEYIYNTVGLYNKVLTLSINYQF